MKQNTKLYLFTDAFQKLESEINITLNFIQNSKDSYHKELYTFNEEYIPYSSNFYYDIRSERLIPFDLLEKNKEEYQLFIKESLNKQFSWYLVDAYEHFVKFLDEIYAVMGYLNLDTWTESQKKKVTQSSNDLDTFRKIVHNGKKRLIYSDIQLRGIRSNTTFLKGYERKNIDYFFRFVLIEKLRHKIAHKNSVVYDKKEFSNEIKNKYKETFKNTTLSEDFKIYIESCFGLNEYKNTICLTDIQKGNKIYPRSSELIENLMSYSRLIFESVYSKFLHLKC